MTPYGAFIKDMHSIYYLTCNRGARENLKKKRGEDSSYPILAFHGTKEENITPIVENGFKVPGIVTISY